MRATMTAGLLVPPTPGQTSGDLRRLVYYTPGFRFIPMTALVPITVAPPSTAFVPISLAPPTETLGGFVLDPLGLLRWGRQ